MPCAEWGCSPLCCSAQQVKNGLAGEGAQNVKQQSAVAFAPSRVHPESPQKSANCYLWATGPNLSVQTSANTTPSALSSHIFASDFPACCARTSSRTFLLRSLPMAASGPYAPISVCKPAQILPQVRPAQSATRHDFYWLILLCISSARVLTSESCQQLPLGHRPHLNVHSRTHNPPAMPLWHSFPCCCLSWLSALPCSSSKVHLWALCVARAFVVLLKLQNAGGGEEYRS